MPKRRADIPWPKHGLNEDASFSEQPGLTAREFENVRTIDPKTGRSRGGQRPGHSRLLEGTLSGSSKVADLNMALDDKPRLVYNERGDSASDAVPLEWQVVTASEDAAYGVDTDQQGNVYVLDGNNAVAKYNPTGELVHTIQIQTTAETKVARRLVVDEFDNVYVGVFSGTTATGLAGEIIKYRKVGDEFGKYREHWRFPLDGSPADFAVRFGTMGVLENRDDLQTGSAGESFSYIVAVDNILGKRPEKLWEQAVPWPGNAVQIGSNGAFYTTHEANTDRNTSPGSGDFTTTAVSWVPYELTNADQRIFFWVDAEEVSGLADGARVTEWADRRFVSDYTGDGGSDFSADEPLDDQDRNFASTPTATARLGPRYRTKGAGSKPSLRFNQYEAQDNGTDPPGNALHSRETPDGASDAKVDADGVFQNQLNLFPSHVESNYFTVLAVRIRGNSSRSSVVLSTWGADPVGGTAKRISILGNADENTADAGEADGGISSVVSGGVVVRMLGAGNYGSGTTQIKEGSIAGNDPDVAIITICDNQANSTDAVSSWRLNGSPIDRWTQTTLNIGTPLLEPMTNTFTLLGHGSFNQASSGNDQYPVADKWVGITGDVLEAITILTDTTTTPHDDEVDQPLHTASPAGLPPITGENGGSVAPGPTALSTEVEKVEGYVAHKWGVSHLLPNGDGGGAVDGLFPDHPHGGTANTPSGNGSDLAFDSSTLALQSQDPITAKWGSNFGELRFALSGGGMGYGLVLDSNNDVMTIGTKVAGTGPSGADESNVIGRKIIDQGTAYSADEGTEATQSYTVGSGPTVVDGDTLTVGGRTYIYRTSIDDAVAGEVLIDGGGDETVTADNMEAAINREGTAGTTYSSATLRNDNVYVASRAGAVLTINAKVAGTAGDSITIVVTGAGHSVGGATLSGGVDGDGAWTFDDSGDQKTPTYQFPQMVVDTNDDLYIPIADSNQTFHLVKRNGQHGHLEWIYDDGDATIEAYGIAFDPTVPRYDKASITGPPYGYLTTDNGTPAVLANHTLHKLEFVAVASEGSALAANLRETVFVGVAGGNIVTFQKDGSVTTPTGGSAALDSTSNHIFSARAFRKIYFTDGLAYKKYDPSGYDAASPASGTDEVTAWEASGDGEIPKNAKLIAFWNNRIVLGRFADDPQNWAMCKKGRPNGWDFFPAVPTVRDAIAGNDSRAGACPDVINALVPYSDDLLIIGGDSTIQMMTGDPADGGYFDLISDSTGMAFGQPWCKDPEGVLYFVGSRGGVYAMRPGTLPLKMTRDTIERRLESVDLTAYRPVMAWDTFNEGMYLYYIPWGLGGTAIDGYFWDKKNDAWSVVSFSDTDYQPTALAVFDGDESADRVVVIGCEDGRVRFVDEDAKNDDDGTTKAGKIDSSLLFGPIAAGNDQNEHRFSHLEVLLAEAQDGATVEWFVTDTPDAPLDPPKHVREFRPGRNPWDLRKLRGSFVWIRIRNATLNQRWALERLSIGFNRAGRSRVSPL